MTYSDCQYTYTINEAGEEVRVEPRTVLQLYVNPEGVEDPSQFPHCLYDTWNRLKRVKGSTYWCNQCGGQFTVSRERKK